MKNLNGKTKLEKLFILSFLCLFGLGLLCFTGCTGGSCETVRCGKEDIYDTMSVKSCSVPGCGGCLSPERGCNCCLYAQSHKLVYGKINENSELNADGWVCGCDNRYYTNGCLGCGTSEKSCYMGFISYEDDNNNLGGFFYRNVDLDYPDDDKPEKLIGCSNGCGGCIASDDLGWDLMYMSEVATDTD